MNRGLISIVVLLLVLTGCSRHRGQRTGQANREVTHNASAPASLTKPVSDPQAPDSFPRPSPFAEHSEPERQPLALSEPTPAPETPSAAPPATRAKTAAPPEENRRAFKPFVPKSADTSRDRLALLPGPPPLPSNIPNPASSLVVGHKTCCVGTATFEAARPARLQRMLGKVPGLRRIRQSPDSVEGYVAPRPARQISMMLPPEARAVLTGGTMDLKASVDESGRVTRVQLLSPKDEELVRLAAYAANAWPFVPAKVNDKAVPSEVILHFTFSGN